MVTSQYISELQSQWATGRSTEHSYRGFLRDLVASLSEGIEVTNEPKRIDCGAPDYILTRKRIPIGYIEAKDIGADLDSKTLKAQFDRYKSSLENLIITDYIEFRFYRGGEFRTSIRIGEVIGQRIEPITSHFERFEALIKDFVGWEGRTISSPKKLAELMAGKARMMADVIERAVSSDVETKANTDLRDQMEAFKTILIHDINHKTFADLYAQTVSYGMFAARLHDDSLDTFSRLEAATLIPQSNPFLRKLFQNISGVDLDKRISWIVDDLADIFRATDVGKFLENFGRGDGKEDAFMHFYEDFLGKYDAKVRKSRGVWFTPYPVVQFIVRAVDDILKDDFGLMDGLADTSRTEQTPMTHVADNATRSGLHQKKREVHRVQVLDPATGTGTFLAEVIRHVHSKFKGQEGIWPQYVSRDLIPRLNGFEILMASYAVAHLKLDLVLKNTGFDVSSLPPGVDHTRLRIYLTNTLEEAHPATGSMFSRWLSEEANEANAVKRDTPVMVVLGNPPYSGVSSNMGSWITALIEDYKYVDGEHFGERKHWLHDDYVKFIRYSEHLINKTGEGILAFVNNHGFLDNPSFRGMRWHLLQSFDKIYIIDLHGNTNKKEQAPDGQRDENVFNIQQGVSINIFVKTGKKANGSPGTVFHADLWGDKSSKYTHLYESSIDTEDWVEVNPRAPFYFLYPRDESELDAYEDGIPLDKLFVRCVTGIVTARDSLVVDIDRENLLKRILDFSNLQIDDEVIREKYFGNIVKGKYPPGDSRGWRLPEARRLIADYDHSQFIETVAYRPFDNRYIYYHPKMVDWGRESVFGNLIQKDNLCFVFPKQAVTDNWSHVQLTRFIPDNRLHYSNKGITVAAPVFIYSGDSGQVSTHGTVPHPNINPGVVSNLLRKTGLRYEFNENDIWANGTEATCTPLDVVDYCYAVLHSQAYREKYLEFLKSEYPRIPLPETQVGFRRIVQLGSMLRSAHLMDSISNFDITTRYPIRGSNVVERRMTKNSPGYESKGLGKGNVWINDTQYFEDVPEVAWQMNFGGYQPAQKWLKDRHGRVLSVKDIQYYQRVIAALVRTQNLMNEIDLIGVE